jgi:hypothetical protein
VENKYIYNEEYFLFMFFKVSKLKPFDRTRADLSGIKSAANRAKTK